MVESRSVGRPDGSSSTERDATLLRLASRLARLGGWSIEVANAELYWSSELFTMLGFDGGAGPPAYEVAIGLYPDGHRETMREAVDRCMKDGTPMDLESVILDRHGRPLRVRTVGEAVRDDTGAIVRIEGAFYDITEIVHEREERIAAQERLSRTLEHLPALICFIDRQWRITFANQATIALSGLTEEELYSDTVWNLFSALSSDRLTALYRAAMDEGRSGTERDRVAELGVWLEVTAYPIDGGIALFGREVTDDESRRHEFLALATEAQRQAALLDASNEAMIMEDLDNVVTYWNRGAERIYGWSREEVVGRNIREILYTDTAEFEIAAAALHRDGSWSGEMTQRTKDGRTVYIECRWQAVRDDAGAPVSFFAVNSDITQRRRERELQSRAQRMESLGTLAGGIAHDLNNVLTPLLMAVQLMKSQEPSDQQGEMLNTMETGLKRGADMIRQVLAFARGVEGKRDHVDVDELLREFSAMALQTLPESIEVVTSMTSLPPLVGDKTQVLQVLMNLAANARDAMPGGGTLTISTSRRSVEEDSSTLAMLATGEYALLSVEDTGAGMTLDELDRIFEPFYTTKEHGSGTGLGLATSLAIVRSHGGRIVAYSEPGVGSRFDVYLPLSTEELAKQVVETDSAKPLPHGEGELVLIVDDEVSIRRMIAQTLEAHGYRTLVASNGREAIEVFDQHASDVRLVFTDLMMPVMDGAATAAYFTEHHPQIPIIAASGLHANGRADDASDSGVRHFVAKPFTTLDLLRTIRLALDEAE